MASNAPRFQWKRDPAGRTALVTLLSIAHRQGFTDDVVCTTSKLPEQADIEQPFLTLLPWFPQYYDKARADRAVRIGYLGKLDPFSISDAYDRLYHMFLKYAISDEHPLSTEQAKPGKLRETWLAIREQVAERIRAGKAIELEEALSWGRQALK